MTVRTRSSQQAPAARAKKKPAARKPSSRRAAATRRGGRTGGGAKKKGAATRKRAAAVAAAVEDEPAAAADAAAAADDEVSSESSSDGESAAFAEDDALLTLLPSPDKPRQTKPRIVVFHSPDMASLRRVFAYCSPIRLALCRAVSKDWNECCSGDEFWRHHCDQHFPGGTDALRDELREDARCSARDRSYMMLYRLRSKLMPVSLPASKAADDFDSGALEARLEDYSALVEIEVLRAVPFPSTVVVAEVLPVYLEPWRPTGRWKESNLEDGDDSDSCEGPDRPMRVCVAIPAGKSIAETDLGDLRLSLTLVRNSDNKCLGVFGDALMVLDEGMPTFEAAVQGSGALARLGAKHVARFDSVVWSKYKRRTKRETFHGGADGLEQRGAPDDAAGIEELGMLSYTFLPSKHHSWSDALPDLETFWADLDWHNCAQSADPTRHRGAPLVV